MPVAATFAAAANLAGQNVQGKFQGVPSLKTLLASWVASLPATLTEPGSVAQRTVLNWVPDGTELGASIPTLKASQEQGDANNVSTYLYRTCKAIEFGITQGRVTAAQGVTLLASYNALWA